ncbi:hypothetical protein [Selenomonas ruminantium]|uniref:Uncharacterized protein n=1 Tax=Selenomonas ruminantium TaxID=971 RepID=A0A1I0Y2D4_SELRU|nr:hypothetical protein [Selenomonas ruminantium]SFB07342.1 hypothetical protein SAMN05216587_10966 [Selenomonas ruminantium]
MLKANILVNGYGYVARRDYIYCCNVMADRVQRCKMTPIEKERVRLYEEEAYDDAKIWQHLNAIWKSHEEKGELQYGTLRDYYGR